MLAALYHDVATPPFGHAVEEFLYRIYGFDHEKKVRDLIFGTSNELAHINAEVFLGKPLKLRRVLQSKKST